MQGLHDPMPTGDLPVNPLTQFMAHGLAGIQIEGVVSEQCYLDVAHMGRINPVAQSQFGGESIVHSAGFLFGVTLGKTDVQTVSDDF